VIAIVKEIINIKEQNFEISCSVGISIFPKDTTDKTELIKYADTAMYNGVKMATILVFLH